MSPPYEFGDGNAIVKVGFDDDGWQWFRDLVQSELGPTDLFRRDVEAADAYLHPLREDEE